MRRFYTLFCLEFAGLIPKLCVLVGVMALSESIFWGLTLWNDDGIAPFAYLIDSSGIPIIFCLSFAALLIIISLSLAQNYSPSKNIYALLSLSVRRERVYHAKLFAALLAGFCIVSAQLLLLLLAFAAYKYIPIFGLQLLHYRNDGNSAVLYLMLLNSRFFRLLFPPDAFSLAFSLSVLCGAICMSLSAQAQVRAGRKLRAVIMTAVWLLLVLVTFPLTDYKLPHSTIKLVLLIVLILSVNIMGERVFKSGEAAA